MQKNYFVSFDWNFKLSTKIIFISPNLFLGVPNRIVVIQVFNKVSQRFSLLSPRLNLLHTCENITGRSTLDPRKKIYFCEFFMRLLINILI